jgi:hypothetical protein
VTAARASVTYADPEPNGLASMLGTLIEQNLARDPGRADALRPATVSLRASDAGVAATLRIGRGGVEVVNGCDPAADLVVITDGERMLRLAAVPLRSGVPDPLTASGREVVGSLLRGRLLVRGLARHPAMLRRLQRLLSAT